MQLSCYDGIIDEVMARQEVGSQMTVGILCHGQLAKMTAEAANNIGITTRALGPGKNSPASYTGIEVVDGDFNDPDTVRKFSQTVDSLVLDTDHVQDAILHDLQNEGMLIIPKAENIHTIRNRIRLKKHFNDHGIPTAPWMPVGSLHELQDAYKRLGGDIIVKTAEEGFDGRGNEEVTTSEKLEETWDKFNGQELIAEKRLNLRRELAVMLAKDVKNGRAFYPVVESYHKEGMLEYIYLPSHASRRSRQKALEIGDHLLDSFEGAGLFGLELFETKDGEVLANEVAGRPHNTGHYTIEACITSQFEQLVRIGTNNTIGPVFLNHPGEMVMMHNLNGGTKEQMTEKDFEKVREYNGELHWYEKSPRPRRKRGHITLFGSSRQELRRNADKAIKAIHFFA